MRQLNVIFLVNCLTILTIYVKTSSSSTPSPSTIDYDQQWVEYKLKYSKSYSDADEDETRKRLWRNNLDKVNYHNDKADRGLRSYRLTVNQFTDLNAEELPNSDYYQSTGTNQFGRSRLGLSRLESHVNSTVIVDDDDDDLPEAVDWRNHGWVSPARHRRGCWQSGWAFAIVDAIEGQVFNATKRLTPLSVAALIDCSFGSNHLLGCLNGTIKDGYDYLMDNLGLPIEKDYPYSGYRRRCYHYPLSMVNVTIKGYRQVEPTEKALKRAVATIGPISVMMDAAGEFRTYSSGIFNDYECGTRELNHGVTIVGYGHDEGKDYWIVRNNNGNVWGERGYIRIQRNWNNLCGLASQAYYPIL